MEKTTLKAKDFSSRGELENKVRNLVELTPDLKPEYEIQGTQKELARLQLSRKTIFYGIRCIETDFDEKSLKIIEKPQRGEIKPFGLNGQLKIIK